MFKIRPIAGSPKSMINRSRMAGVFLSGLLFFISISATAQYAGYKPVSDLVTFKKEFAIRSSQINSIISNFTQEKVLSALTEKITSTGNFRFKRSDKVRIEYIQPFSYLVVMNGDKMMVKDGEKQNQVSMRSNKLFQQINRIIIDCIQGTILDSRDFSTKIWESETSFLMEMEPASKNLKNFFDTVVLIVDKSDYSVHSIQMNEPSGDHTIITFTDKKLNVSVQDAVFAL
jgi:outer membrane lipoprotein-sorting protein